MPSINEVWEQALQINANLVTVHNDLEALKTCCAQEVAQLGESNDWLETIHDTLNQGFTNVSDGIAGVHARQDLTNKLLLFHLKQTQTVICLLDKIARNTCDLVTESDRQTRLQDAIAGDLDGMKHIAETVHPAGALALQRASEARTALEACCRPTPPPPRCTFEPCPEPQPPGHESPAAGKPFTAVPARVRRARRPG